MTEVNNEAIFTKILTFIQETSKTQTEEIKKYMKEELDEIKYIITDEVRKRKEIELKYNDLKTKYEQLEKVVRKNNIIIFGLENTSDNLVSYTVNKLNSLLHLNLSTSDISDVYTIGKRQENKPTIVKFLTYMKKVEVIQNCKKLKGTGISISEELTSEERQRNKILRDHAKQARIQNKKAYVRGNKLFIENEAFTVEELINISEQEDPVENNPKQKIVQEKQSSNLSTIRTTTQFKRTERQSRGVKEKEEDSPKVFQQQVPLWLQNKEKPIANQIIKNSKDQK